MVGDLISPKAFPERALMLAAEIVTLHTVKKKLQKSRIAIKVFFYLFSNKFDSCDLTKKIAGARKLKSAETEVNVDGGLIL